MRKIRRKTAVTWIALAFYVSGIIAAIDAVMTTRTAPGAIAWSVSLVSFPFVAVPAYLVFGRNKFDSFRRPSFLTGTGQGLTLLVSAVMLFLLSDKSPLLTEIMVSLNRAILVAFPASFAAIVVDSLSK